MLKNWTYFLLKITHEIWFTAVCYGLFGVFIATQGILFKGSLPDVELIEIGADSVESILTILATSMLTVATFSLTTMVTAFGNASISATPRVTQLMLDDKTAQRSIATFVGAFLYSIVGIVALATKSYGDEGRFILFVSTIFVIGVIVVTFFRWISQLSTLGLMNENIDRVKKAALHAITEYKKIPSAALVTKEDFKYSVSCESTGHIVSVNFSKLEELSKKFQIKSHLMVLPGRFLYPTTKVLAVTSAVTKEQEDALKECIFVEPTRSFEQDPRFGLIVLSEVASKALSPGINDPGTAIAVLNAGTEVFRLWHENIHLRSVDKAEEFKLVSVQAIDSASLFEDFFGPITRDGAALIEVVLRSQKILASLAKLDLTQFQPHCRIQAERSLEMALKSLSNQYDKEKAQDFFAKSWII